MKALYTALASFQQEVPAIKKNASGYGYKFADLDEITKVIKPLMAKHKLGYSQPIDGTTLKTIVFHTESGEAIESGADIPQGVSLKGQNEFQTMGSAITYLRRYGLVSTLGLVTDEDADGAGEQVKTAPKASSSLPATDKQRDLIRTLARQQGTPDESIEARLKQITTSAEASEAIAKLKA